MWKLYLMTMYLSYSHVENKGDGSNPSLIDKDTQLDGDPNKRIKKDVSEDRYLNKEGKYKS